MELEKRRKRVEGAGVVIVLLLAGAGATALLMMKSKPAEEVRPRIGPLVEVMTVRKTDAKIQVTGHGEVRARYQATLIPEVSGRVVGVHERLASGGFVRAGETLVTIDPTDFELSKRRAEAAIATAKAAEESATARIAEAQVQVDDLAEDLKRMRELRAADVANDRELRKAQTAFDAASANRRSAEASRATARAQIQEAHVTLEQAAVNLQRTKLSVPFDAVVISETVDAGQIVTAGQPLGELYATSVVEVMVPVQDHELGWLTRNPIGAITGQSDAEIPVRIELEFANRKCEWSGRVTRTEGVVDRVSRMVRLVVEVREPFDVDESDKPPLMPGAFVSVSIEGRVIKDVAVIPRDALHEEDVVWLEEGGRLRMIAVTVARREKQDVYVSGGLEEGDRIILSAIDAPIEGMEVRVKDQAVTGGE